MAGLTELGRQWNDAVGSSEQPWATLQFADPGMTHEAEQPNPAIAELARRLNLTGQNLYNTWIAPAERLGRAATTGTLDVTDPQTAGDAFGLVGGVAGARMPFAKVGELGSAGGKPITAYHGSPHDFDRFDLSKIGTGQGEQAYGHGLYFAENEGVAKDYKGKLSTLANVNQSPEANSALMYLQRNNFDKAKARSDLEDSIGMKLPDTHGLVKAINDYNPGKMYQVAINADPEHFLDWDKPLSEQSEHVQKALQSSGVDISENLTGGQAIQGGRPSAAANKAQLDPIRQRMDELMRKRGLTDKETEELDSLGERLSAIRNNPGNDSEVLSAAGIPGIKYLDQGSRSAGEGSRNFVVFDDKLIDILKKYGLLGLFPSAAASQVGPNTGQQ